MAARHPFFLFFCLLLFVAGKAQDDTTRLRQLTSAAFDAYSTDPEKGLLYASEAIDLATKLGDKSGLAVAWRTRGLNYFSLGKDSQAFSAYDRSLALARSAKDERSIAKTLHAIGLVYNSRSAYDKAIDYHSQALTIFRQLKDSNSAANAANSLGINYLYLGDLPRAIESYQQALDVFVAGHNVKGIGLVYTNMGIVYRRMLAFNKAIEYDQKALDVYSRRPIDSLQRANVLANLANVYDDMNEPRKALLFYDSALSINERIRNQRGIANNTLNKGILYNGLSDYANALLYLKRGLELSRQVGDKNNESAALSELGKAVQHAPPSVLAAYSEKRESAIRYEREALRLAEEIGAVENQRDVWEGLARTYEAQGNWRDAMDAYKHYLILKDSVFSDSTQQRITRLTMQYEQEKKEARLQAAFAGKQALAAAALSRQRWLTFAVVVVLVVFAVAAFVVFGFYKRRQDAERRYELSELEMKALRSQMNPHFIFNSLNSIRDYMMRHRTEEAGEYLVRFANLMRSILENSEQKEVPIGDDIEAMKLYMELESLRLNNKFRYRIDVDDSIDVERTYIPPLILQPFIENSIWHGLNGKAGDAGLLTVGIHRKEEMLCCVVEDNGKGRSVSDGGVSRRSFGMKITSDRIKILNKNATMRVVDLEQGTRVEIWLPLLL